MKIRYLIIILFFSSACNQPTTDENVAIESDETTKTIADQFETIKKVLDKDNGAFWERQLYGPTMIVDQKSRKIWANQNSKSNLLKADGRIFTGELEADYTISNSAFDYDGERWTMIMNPLPKNDQVRNSLIIHESFHRIQPALGFKNMLYGDNGHLDSKEGRTLLKLELEALKKALDAQEPAGILHYVEHALWFRKLRHDSFENAPTAENQLEINEGLSQYTGFMLGFSNQKERSIHIQNAIDDFYQQPTFVRSFAYHTIPAYGVLLSRLKSRWHLGTNVETNLTELFNNAFKVTFPQDLEKKVEVVKENYNYALIESQENARATKMRDEINRYKAILLADSFFVLPLIKMNFSYDPNTVLTVENIGNIYPSTTIIDNWGKLEVTEGALISNNWDKVNVSKPTFISDSLVSGQGWTLKLSSLWKVETNNGHYLLNSR